MNILALTKYSYAGPSSRYRFYNYQKYFLNGNIEMIIKPLFGKHYLGAKYSWQKTCVAFASYVKRLCIIGQLLVYPKKYDLILLEYELLPYMPGWFEYWLIKRGVKYIVDYDDAIFHKYDKHQNALIRNLFKNKIAKVMNYAQTVIVCNAYLGAYAKQYNQRVITLPTVVLLDKYVEAMNTQEKHKNNDFVIGWMGSWTTGTYVLELIPTMIKFVEKYKDVRFHLVGFNERLLSKKEREDAHIDVIMWSEESEIQEILKFDVGIMPLPDDAWSRGKCGFKLVQYMSCKKPVIASAVGINCTVVENDMNGILVKDSGAWFSAFEKLYLENTETMKKIGDNNFKKIVEQFNIKKNVKRYQAILNSIVREDMKKC